MPFYCWRSEELFNCFKGAAVVFGHYPHKLDGVICPHFNLSSQIADASAEQTEGVDQINVAVAEMDKVTQTNAAISEESAAADEELSHQAHKLNDLVQELANIVGRGRAAAAPIAETVERPLTGRVPVVPADPTINS